MKDSPAVQAITRAVEAGDAEIVAALLAESPEMAQVTVHNRDSRGDTLLHAAIPTWGEPVTAGHLAVLRLLLDAGVGIDSSGHPANNEGGTPLIWAAWGNHDKAVALLLERGADTTATPLKGETAMDTAARHGNTNVVEALIAGGATVTFHQVVQAGLTERVRTMLAADPNLVRQVNSAGDTPLHAAIGEEARYVREIVEFLLDSGADIESEDTRGRTPLLCALEGGKADAVGLLRERGAATSGVCAAIALGEWDRAVSMVEAETQQEVVLPDGTSLLLYAARFGCEPVVKVLLDRGADPNRTSDRWWMDATTLHTAAHYGHTEICRLLLDAGAGIETANLQNYQPLHIAARWRNPPVVALLLERGANPNARDGQGRSVLDWAGGYMNLPELLRAYGAKQEATCD